MRISDWSSDVCSSDLLHLCRQLDPGHHPDRADAAAQSIQEQLQRRRIVRERRAVGARRVQLSVEVSQRYLRAEPRGRRAAGTPAGLCQGLWLARRVDRLRRSEEHTSELQSLMRLSYAVFCLQHKKYI